MTTSGAGKQKYMSPVGNMGSPFQNRMLPPPAPPTDVCRVDQSQWFDPRKMRRPPVKPWYD